MNAVYEHVHQQMHRHTKIAQFPTYSVNFTVPCLCLFLLPYMSGLRLIGSCQRGYGLGFAPFRGLGMGSGKGLGCALGRGMR